MRTLRPGDKVAFSPRWLESIDIPHDHLTDARGVITAIQQITPRLLLALVDWQHPKSEDIPVAANTANLTLVSD